MFNLDQKLQIINIIVQGLMAFGTILVAIIAIWGDWIKAHIGMKPKLILLLSDPHGEQISIPLPGPEAISSIAYSYHLKVINENRFIPSTNTRVVIKAVYRANKGSGFTKYPLSGPMQLLWQYASLHPAYLVIGPPTICDLGVIRLGDSFNLATFTNPPDFPGKLGANQLLLIELQAVSDNADSEPIQVLLYWDGEWSSNHKEMSKHFTVTQLLKPWPQYDIDGKSMFTKKVD